jgi:hypothetical protein
MGQRASVLVAAGPSFAGKTTTLNVMLDFLPPSVNQITLNGSDEDFGFLKDAEASRTYMIAEEFSEYMDYVWGEAAQRAFQLLTEGYGLGGTIHARTAKEALLVLHEYLEVPVEALSGLGAVVMIRATPGRLYGSQPVRRVESVSLVLPHEKGIAIQPIASRELGNDTFVLAAEEALQAALEAKFGMQGVDVAAEMAARTRVLADLQAQGRVARDEVRQAVARFYEPDAA